MTENPLVAGAGYSPADLALPANFDNPGAAFEGSGALGGLANMAIQSSKGDWAGFAAEFAGFGFDMLGVAMNPMKGLLSAGIGWLIEHVGFLNVGLDLLAGDPGKVSEMAQTWDNIANHLSGSAEDFRVSLGQVTGSGHAIDGYRATVTEYMSAVHAAADHARSASQHTQIAGTVVAVTRGLVRDLISEWAADRAIKWLAASSLTPVTFGGAQAVFITDSVISGSRLSLRIAGELRGVAGRLDELASGAARSSGALTRATSKLDEFAGGGASTTRAANAGAAARSADNLPLNTRVKNLEDDVADLASKDIDKMARADPRVQSANAKANQLRHEVKNPTSNPRGPRGNQTKQKAENWRAKKANEAERAADNINAKKSGEIRDGLAKEADDLAGQRYDLGRARAEKWQEDIRLPGDRLNEFVDNSHVRTVGESQLSKAAKEIGVQTTGADDRADEAREASEEKRAKWRTEGNLD